MKNQIFKSFNYPVAVDLFAAKHSTEIVVNVLVFFFADVVEKNTLSFICDQVIHHFLNHIFIKCVKSSLNYSIYPWIKGNSEFVCMIFYVALQLNLEDASELLLKEFCFPIELP